MQQRGQPHAGQGFVAAQFESAGQHALGHDAPCIPFHCRHHLRQHFARVAARPIIGLTLKRGIGVACGRGDGPGLHNPESLAVPGPLDVVAGAAVVQRAGSVASHVAQRFGLGIRQHGLRGARGGRVAELRPSVRGRRRGEALGADAPPRDGPRLAQVILAQVIGVAVRLAVHQRLSQPPVRVDDHLVVAARRGIDGEGDARGHRVDHRHHHHRHAVRAVRRQVETLTVSLRLGRKQRIPDAPERLSNRVGPPHVQAGQVDAGKRGARGVFLRRGRAQRQGTIQPPAFAQGLMQHIHDSVGYVPARLMRAAGLGGQHEAVRYRHAEPRHAAQLPTLAARGLRTGFGRRRPVQHQGAHAALPPTPCTKRAMAASNSCLSDAPGWSSHRSSAPR